VCRFRRYAQRTALPARGAGAAALGLLGAVVMPHNLFLHSSLVMTRDVDRTSHARVRTRAPTLS
jgi:Mn2+/Fe2+ NRAMP family transporter